MAVAAARGQGESYAFVVGPCEGQPPALRCSFNVRLMAGDKVVSTLALDPVWSDSTEPVAPSGEWGMGDPLGQPRGWKVWRVGQGDAAVVVGASPIRLGPRHEGLLIRRVYRGEARQVLAARRESGLFAVEISGRWTAISIEPRGADRDQLVLFARWPGEPGFVWANEPAWDDRTEALVYDSWRDPGATLVAMGPYASQQDAAAGTAVLSGTVVAPTDPYAGVASGKWMAAAVTGEAKLAQKALDTINHRTPVPPALMVPLRFRWSPRIRHDLGEGERLEIGLGAFDGKIWPLTLRLLDADRVMDGLTLDWPVSTPVMEPAPDVDLPAGDPLRPWRGDVGWSLGDSETAALAAIRPLRLQGGRPAFLLVVEAGFEHRKRRLDVVTVDDGHLRTAWQFIDPEGPGWSTVVVHPRGDGPDEILHLSFYEDSVEGNVDRIDVARIAWDAKKKALSESPLGCDGSVAIVVLRTFAKLEQALAAKAQPCPSPIGSSERPRPLVLPAPRNSRLRGYVLAYVSTDKAAARKLASEAARCLPHKQLTVLPWCNRK